MCGRKKALRKKKSRFVENVTHAGEALPQERLAEASALPPNTSVHLGWVVRNVLQPDGYITAACKEVCLQLFGGLNLPTQLNRLSDAFRPPVPLPPRDTDEERIPDDAALADAAFAARRQEQTRGPGCPGSAAATHSRTGEPAEPMPPAAAACPVGLRCSWSGMCAGPWTPNNMVVGEVRPPISRPMPKCQRQRANR